MSVNLEQYVGQRVCLVLADQTYQIGVVGRNRDSQTYPFYIGDYKDDPVEYTSEGRFYLDATSHRDIVRVLSPSDFTLIEWNRSFIGLPDPDEAEPMYFLSDNGDITTSMSSVVLAPEIVAWAPVQRPPAETEDATELSELRRQVEVLTARVRELEVGRGN